MTDHPYCPDCGNQLRTPDFTSKNDITSYYWGEIKCAKCKTWWSIEYDEDTGFDMKTVKRSKVINLNKKETDKERVARENDIGNRFMGLCLIMASIALAVLFITVSHPSIFFLLLKITINLVAAGVIIITFASGVYFLFRKTPTD